MCCGDAVGIAVLTDRRRVCAGCFVQTNYDLCQDKLWGLRSPGHTGVGDTTARALDRPTNLRRESTSEMQKGVRFQLPS